MKLKAQDLQTIVNATLEYNQRAEGFGQAHAITMSLKKQQRQFSGALAGTAHAPTAQLFPFDANIHWPQEIAGRKMETYHEWMKGVLPITMSGCPALAAPAGFSDQGLPIGIQIVGPNRSELSCLQLAYAYDTATAWPNRRPPRLLNEP